jgi:hypothetical protein
LSVVLRRARNNQTAAISLPPPPLQSPARRALLRFVPENDALHWPFATPSDASNVVYAGWSYRSRVVVGMVCRIPREVGRRLVIQMNHVVGPAAIGARRLGYLTSTFLLVSFSI